MLQCAGLLPYIVYHTETACACARGVATLLASCSSAFFDLETCVPRPSATRVQFMLRCLARCSAAIADWIDATFSPATGSAALLTTEFRHYFAEHEFHCSATNRPTSPTSGMTFFETS